MSYFVTNYFLQETISANLPEQTTAAHAIRLAGDLDGVHSALFNVPIDRSSMYARKLRRIRALDELRVLVTEWTPYQLTNDFRRELTVLS